MNKTNMEVATLKRILISILLVIVLAVLSSCEMTLATVKTEYNKKDNTLHKTITILPGFGD